MRRLGCCRPFSRPIDVVVRSAVDATHAVASLPDVDSRCDVDSSFLALLFAAALAAQAQQTKETIKFQLRDGYLMVVDAKVNGAGPFRFLVDTGTTRTVIDPDLANQLQAARRWPSQRDHGFALPTGQAGSVAGCAAGRGLRFRPGRNGRQAYPAKNAGSRDSRRSRRGFSFQVRPAHRLQETLHSVRASPPAGERCRFEAIGQYQGAPTTNRLLIDVEFMEVERAQGPASIGYRCQDAGAVSWQS